MNKCVICGLEIKDNRKVCSRRCAGFLGGAKEKPIQPKVAKMNKEGYLYYTYSMLDKEEKELMKGGSRIILVHRLVMAKYLGRRLGKGYVLHVNGNKLDNRIENLTLGDARLNSKQHLSAVNEAIRWKNLVILLLFIKLS